MSGELITARLDFSGIKYHRDEYSDTCYIQRGDTE